MDRNMAKSTKKKAGLCNISTKSHEIRLGQQRELQVCFYRKHCTRAARDRGRKSRAIDAVNAFRVLFRIFHFIWERLGAAVYCCPAFCVAACLITWKWKEVG
ncbi:hypothetical protein KY284_019142 [Solanum tuberosum]|nr:hypothetical protein KY284_019142 [Solanum tuberosum]